MTGLSKSYLTYTPCSDIDMIRIADGTLSPISRKGANRNLKLSSVLHVSIFANNLLSMSSITKDLKCKITFFPTHYVLKEVSTRENYWF